jgi:hypothetical protein
VPALIWSNDLASQAQGWANHLASRREFRHSGTSGEYLWMGTSRRYSFTNMVDRWGRAQYFTNGMFPNVIRKGNWAAVAHYTHMVWRNTRYVDCGGADGSDGNYRLACRYSPAGNVMGQRTF